jgi:hypothetical protein
LGENKGLEEYPVSFEREIQRYGTLFEDKMGSAMNMVRMVKVAVQPEKERTNLEKTREKSTRSPTIWRYGGLET